MLAMSILDKPKNKEYYQESREVLHIKKGSVQQEMIIKLNVYKANRAQRKEGYLRKKYFFDHKHLKTSCNSDLV